MTRENKTAADSDYTGTDNLEMMRLAVNYSAHLVDLLQDACKDASDVLDFGAGLGIYAQALVAREVNVRCLEIDRTHIECLKTAGLDVITGAEEIQDQSFDLIYSLNVLEHIDDDLDIMRKFYRWLRPGGKLLIYVPAFMHLYTSMDRKVGHIRRYSKHELTQKAKVSGFSPQDCRYVDSLGYLATLLYKFAGNSKGDISERGLTLYDRYFFPLSRSLDHAFHGIAGKNVMLIAKK